MNLKSEIKLIKRVSSQELLFFTKHLSTMMKAGIPITDALDTLIAQADSNFFKNIIDEILSDIKNGKSLAQAMGRHPNIFDEFYVSLIEIAEESGTLDENLEFLAVSLSKSYALRKKIQSALMYPGIVLFAIVIMGSFISLFVLPQLVEFFDSFAIDLPPTTKVLVFFANLMKNYGFVIFALLIVGIFLFTALIRNKYVKPYWHNLLLKMPIVGRLISYGQLARFSRNLGTLIKSGVPAPHGMEITANTLTNLRFRNDLLEITKLLTRGKNIGESMASRDFSEFPPLVSRMITVGEKTGKLDETLIYLGEFYEEEVDDVSRNLSTILEPVLLITIGLVVGFVALSIISPIYQLTGSIRN